MLCAYAAKRAFESKAAVVLRIIGSTRASTNIISLLTGICKQIWAIYNLPDRPLPLTLSGLSEELSCALCNATAALPLVIVLDSLSELTSSQARTLSWFPTSLPPHVALIVATTTDIDQSCMPALSRLFDRSNSEIFFGVRSLFSRESGERVLKTLLESKSRTLTTGQLQAASKKFVENGCLPLYLRMLAKLAARVKSVQGEEPLKALDVSIPGLINQVC